MYIPGTYIKGDYTNRSVKILTYLYKKKKNMAVLEFLVEFLG